MTPEDPVVTQLERYARARLSPSPESTVRMRAELVQAFAERGELARPRVRRRAWSRRWVLAAAVAFALVGGTSLAAAESGAGQPFYPVKLAIESWTVPARGQARVEALLGQLEARLAEAEQGSRRADAAAIADAIAAYEQELGELKASALALSVGDQHVLDELARHLTVLEHLLGTVPSQAQAGLRRALDQAQRARDAITHRPASPGKPGSLPSRGAAPSARP